MSGNEETREEPQLLVDESMSGLSAIIMLVWATNLEEPAGDLRNEIDNLLRRVEAAGDDLWPAGRRERVRDLLRHGKYKPTGRGKPASEFLLTAARSGEFPLVSPLVDLNNLVSLETGLPCSIFDLDLTGNRLLVRWGLEQESYVFNRAGHEISLKDLLLVCRWTGKEWEPCGNPVKDSMATKVGPDTRGIMAVVYCPGDEDRAVVDQTLSRFEGLVQRVWPTARTGSMYCVIS